MCVGTDMRLKKEGRDKRQARPRARISVLLLLLFKHTANAITYIYYFILAQSRKKTSCLTLRGLSSESFRNCVQMNPKKKKEREKKNQRDCLWQSWCTQLFDLVWSQDPILAAQQSHLKYLLKITIRQVSGRDGYR